jgi:hypothetical protein
MKQQPSLIGSEKANNLASLSSQGRLNLQETMRRSEQIKRKAKMIKTLPSKELLQELFYYEKGVLFRKKSLSKGKANQPIGWIEKNGYWATNVYGVRYRVHRLVWQFHHGNCPSFIDHIDGNKNNNSIENLRLATNQQNNANTKTPKNNKLGLKGVCLDGKKYKASIKVNGKSKHLGYFSDPYEAHIIYCKKAKELFGEFAWTNKNLNI